MRVDKRESVHAVGIPDGKQLSHKAALGHPDERGLLEPGRVHHRDDVVGSLLERRWFVALVRSPNTPLIEQREPDMTAEVLKEPPVELVLPHDLDVGHQWWNGKDVGTRAPLLPRDADTLGVGKGDFRNLHRKSLPRRGERRTLDGKIESWLRRLEQPDMTTVSTAAGALPAVVVGPSRRPRPRPPSRDPSARTRT